ncbi:pentapeptide repeat-containing protein [Nocardia amamiensis]|uniref:pentapeptide repeat-containing protein n=1 Tax=Nocardia amamiensis TaxID=404578 RepID=UPI0033DA3F54
MEGVDFSHATFTGSAEFSRATFAGVAEFGDATFTRKAQFGGATFTGDVSFHDATFTGDARFTKVSFGSGTASFVAPLRPSIFQYTCVVRFGQREMRHFRTLDFHRVPQQPGAWYRLVRPAMGVGGSWQCQPL